MEPPSEALPMDGEGAEKDEPAPNDEGMENEPEPGKLLSGPIDP